MAVKTAAGALLVAVLLVAGCTTAPPAPPEAERPAALHPVPEPEPWPADATHQGPTIDRTAARPKRFLPSVGPVSVSFELGPGASEAQVVIRTEAGHPVRVLGLEDTSPGRHTVSWDGTNAFGEPVPSGVYLYQIRARTGRGGVSLWEGRPAGGAELVAQRFRYDRATGVVSYVLPRPGRVRVRAELSALPYTATLLDWEPQEAGRHEIAWDGRDADRLLDLRPDPRAQFTFNAFELPANSVLLDRGTGPLGRGDEAPLPSGYRHARHETTWCHDFAPHLSLPDAPRRGSGGLPAVSDGGTLRVALDSHDAPHLVAVGFDVLVFLDTVFLFQEVEASDPFNYRLDTSLLSQGPHIVTVNVLSTDDHAGIASLAFWKQ